MAQVGESSLQGQTFDERRAFLYLFICLFFLVPMYKAQVGEASLQGQTFDARRRRPLDNTWEQVSNCLQQATQH